ncbi:MAG: ABC transporter permease [Candidatus Krumholzibacteria bacterium]|nr:ABC transporter permease [Candidatus Krumholzibacteria bacterium]
MNETKVIDTGPVSVGDPSPRPTLSTILWIAWFSGREMARRKWLLSLAMINLLPVLVVLAIRIWIPSESFSAQAQLSGLSFKIYIRFLIPVMAMAVGIPAISEQINSGTLVFMWTRPVKRRAIYLGRLLAAQVVSTGLMSASLVLCFLVMVSEGAGVITFEFLKLYLMTFLLIGLGAFTYSAVFAAMGTFFKKPVLPAILWALGWENLVTSIPARVQELSLRFHLQNLIERPPAQADDLPGVLGALLSTALHRDPVSRVQSVAVLLAVMAVAMVVGVWLLRHKEIEK